MNLWTVSDLHLDHSPWAPAAIPAHDVLVIAGDIRDRPDDALVELQRLCDRIGTRIIFTPGNHDLFGGELSDLDEADVPGVHVLSCGQSVVIEGVRFVGATLWTDFLVGDLEFQSQAWAARHMPDYQHIKRPDGDLIWPKDVAQQHDLHRGRIEAALATPFAGPTVVVTHHAPSLQSIHPGDRTHESAGAMVSDLEPTIWQWQPQLWVHGHVHRAVDYSIRATRVVCNPRGYVTAGWSEETGWDEQLVVHL